MTKSPRRPLRQRWGYGNGSDNPTGVVSHPETGFGSPLKTLLVFLAIIPYAYAFAFAFPLLNILVDHKKEHWITAILVGLFLGIVLTLTGAAWVEAATFALFHAIAAILNRRSRARFYHPYRVAPTRRSGLHRMSKRRAVAYANAGFSASEAQKLEFGARSERPTEDALMMLGALKRIEK